MFFFFISSTAITVSMVSSSYTELLFWRVDVKTFRFLFDMTIVLQKKKNAHEVTLREF